MASKFKVIKCGIDPSDSISLSLRQGWLVLTLLSEGDLLGGISIDRGQVDALIEYLESIRDKVAE